MTSIVDRSLIPPNCTCGAVETTSHFLLYCENYRRERQLYISNLPCPPLADNLLYGNERLTLEQNSSIFIQVHKYIMYPRNAFNFPNMNMTVFSRRNIYIVTMAASSRRLHVAAAGECVGQ